MTWPAVLVDYLDQHRDRFGVEPICEVLASAGTKLAPSICCAARPGRPSAELVPVIRQVHKDNIGVYGARKIHAEVNRKGTKVARCTVDHVSKICNSEDAHARVRQCVRQRQDRRSRLR